MRVNNPEVNSESNSIGLEKFQEVFDDCAVDDGASIEDLYHSLTDELRAALLDRKNKLVNVKNDSVDYWLMRALALAVSCSLDDSVNKISELFQKRYETITDEKFQEIYGKKISEGDREGETPVYYLMWACEKAAKKTNDSLARILSIVSKAIEKLDGNKRTALLNVPAAVGKTPFYRLALAMKNAVENQHSATILGLFNIIKILINDLDSESRSLLLDFEANDNNTPRGLLKRALDAALEKSNSLTTRVEIKNASIVEIQNDKEGTEKNGLLQFICLLLKELDAKDREEFLFKKLPGKDIKNNENTYFHTLLIVLKDLVNTDNFELSKEFIHDFIAFFKELDVDKRESLLGRVSRNEFTSCFLLMSLLHNAVLKGDSQKIKIVSGMIEAFLDDLSGLQIAQLLSYKKPRSIIVFERLLESIEKSQLMSPPQEAHANLAVKLIVRIGKAANQNSELKEILFKYREQLKPAVLAYVTDNLGKHNLNNDVSRDTLLGQLIDAKKVVGFSGLFQRGDTELRNEINGILELRPKDLEIRSSESIEQLFDNSIQLDDLDFELLAQLIEEKDNTGCAVSFHCDDISLRKDTMTILAHNNEDQEIQSNESVHEFSCKPEQLDDTVFEWYLNQEKRVLEAISSVLSDKGNSTSAYNFVKAVEENPDYACFSANATEPRAFELAQRVVRLYKSVGELLDERCAQLRSKNGKADQSDGKYIRDASINALQRLSVFGSTSVSAGVEVVSTVGVEKNKHENHSNYRAHS